MKKGGKFFYREECQLASTEELQNYKITILQKTKEQLMQMEIFNYCLKLLKERLSGNNICIVLIFIP
jgi:hypothetical protein